MKYIKNFYLMLFLLTISGFATGKIYGNYILSSTLKGNVSSLTFILLPSQNFIETYSLLNNSSDYKRLEGYYAYKESGLMDFDFLFERYKSEDSEIIKKAIIWIVQENNNKEKSLDFYRKLYNISPEEVKKFLQKRIEK